MTEGPGEVPRKVPRKAPRKAPGEAPGEASGGSPPGLAAAVRGSVTRDGRVPGAAVQALIDAYGLPSPDPVLFAALPIAAELADPPISRYRVGAVGLEARDGGFGDVVLGGNLEFPGSDLGRTVHAEGAVAIRSFLRGTALTSLAVAEARPCAHCRQTLVEFAWSGGLRVIDPHGAERRLAELYPWPFEPAALGEPGVVPGAVPWPRLALAPDPDVPGAVANALAAAGSRAHAPYSRCPAAVVLRLHDGRLVSGATLENVAFDPTTGPLAVALVALRMGGDGYAAIESAWLAAPPVGPVDDVGVTRGLLAAVAPDPPLTTITWTGFERP